MGKQGTFKTSGIPIHQPGASVFGPTVYVDATNGNDDNLGIRPDRALATIEKGVDIAALEGLDASVIVRRGFYQPASEIALTTDHEGIRIVADRIMPVMAGANHKIYNIGGPDNIFSINGADNVEIAGFRMWPEMSGSAAGINIGNTAGCVGTWIHDNAFVNVEAQNMASSVIMGSDSYELQYTLVEDNLFHCGGSVGANTGIVTWNHSTRSMVRRNHFDIVGNYSAQCGIYISTKGAPRGRIIDNNFNGTEVGVSAMVAQAVYASEAMDAGDFIITGNHTVNLTSPFSAYVIVLDVFGVNYLNDGAVSASG